MAQFTVKVLVHIPWWVRWIYLPLTRFGVWLGLPINTDIVVRDICRAIRLKVL